MAKKKKKQEEPKKPVREPVTFFCPTCMKGWDDSLDHEVKPRECYACRSGTGKSLKDHSTLMASIYQSWADAMEEAYYRNGLCKSKPDIQTDKVTFYDPRSKRSILIVHPASSLYRDVIRTKTVFYKRHSISSAFRKLTSYKPLDD